MSMATQADAAKTASPAVDDGRVDPVDEQLVRELAERARAEGLSLTGPGGLLGRLTKCWKAPWTARWTPIWGTASTMRPGMAAGIPATAGGPRRW